VKDVKEVCKGLEKILQGSVTRMDFRLEDSKIEIENDEDMELNILLDGVRIATFDTSVQRN
jgi:phosphoribosylaminoimidazole-succinocarboxamide synthase